MSQQEEKEIWLYCKEDVKDLPTKLGKHLKAKSNTTVE